MFGLGLGLGVKAKLFGLETQVLGLGHGLAARRIALGFDLATQGLGFGLAIQDLGLGLAMSGLGLGLVPCGLVNIPGFNFQTLRDISTLAETQPRILDETIGQCIVERSSTLYSTAYTINTCPGALL